MNALKVTPDEVSKAIKDQNVQAATGSVGAEQSSDFIQYKINTSGRLKTAEDFGRIIVRSTEHGRQIRLRDVAKIELGASSYSGNSYFNNQSSVALAIYRRGRRQRAGRY